MLLNAPRVALRSTLGYLNMPRWGKSSEGLRIEIRSLIVSSR